MEQPKTPEPEDETDEEFRRSLEVSQQIEENTPWLRTQRESLPSIYENLP